MNLSQSVATARRASLASLLCCAFSVIPTTSFAEPWEPGYPTDESLNRITSCVSCTADITASAQSEDVTQLASNRATGPGDELERRGKRQQITGGVLLGVGVAAPLVTLGVTRARTRGCDSEDCDTGAYMSTRVMMGAGILLGAAGAAVLIRGSFNRRKGRQERLELGVGPGSLVVRGSF